MRILVLSILAMTVVVGCGSQQSPDRAYRRIMEYAESEEWGQVYDSFDAYSKGQMDSGLKMLASFAGVFADENTKQELDDLSGRDLFIRMASTKTGVNQGDFLSSTDYELLKTTKSSNRAVLTIRESGGALKDVVMVLVDGEWKLVLEDSQSERSSAKKETVKEKLERTRQEALAKEEREKKQAEEQTMRQVVTVALVEKSFVGSDWQREIYQDYITIALALENKTDKTIRAVKGVLNFNDVFGDKIYSTSFKFDDGIPPRQRANWDGGIKYNQFDSELTRLKTTDVANITFHWSPVTILFDDGSKLGE